MLYQCFYFRIWVLLTHPAVFCVYRHSSAVSTRLIDFTGKTDVTGIRNWSILFPSRAAILRKFNNNKKTQDKPNYYHLLITKHAAAGENHVKDNNTTYCKDTFCDSFVLFVSLIQFLTFITNCSSLYFWNIFLLVCVLCFKNRQNLKLSSFLFVNFVYLLVWVEISN